MSAASVVQLPARVAACASVRGQLARPFGRETAIRLSNAAAEKLRKSDEFRRYADHMDLSGHIASGSAEKFAAALLVAWECDAVSFSEGINSGTPNGRARAAIEAIRGLG